MHAKRETTAAAIIEVMLAAILFQLGCGGLPPQSSSTTQTRDDVFVVSGESSSNVADDTSVEDDESVVETDTTTTIATTTPTSPPTQSNLDPCPGYHLPFVLGASASYRIETDNGESTSTATVVSIEIDGDDVIATIDTEYDGDDNATLVHTNKYICRSGSIYRASFRSEYADDEIWMIQDIQYDPPGLLEPADVEPGDTWVFESVQNLTQTDNNDPPGEWQVSEPVSFSYAADDLTTVDVPAGHFSNAIKITQDSIEELGFLVENYAVYGKGSARTKTIIPEVTTTTSEAIALP